MNALLLRAIALYRSETVGTRSDAIRRAYRELVRETKTGPEFTKLVTWEKEASAMSDEEWTVACKQAADRSRETMRKVGEQG